VLAVTEGQSDQSVKDIFSVVVVTEAPQGLDIFSHASADLFSRPRWDFFGLLRFRYKGGTVFFVLVVLSKSISIIDIFFMLVV
jgi:hypothetical protein